MATDSLILLVGEGDPLHAAIEYTLLDYQITLASTPTARLKESLRATWPHLVVLIGDAAQDGGKTALAQLKGPGLRALPKVVLLGNAKEESKPPIAQIISRDLDVGEIAALLHAALSSEVIEDQVAPEPLPTPDEFGPNVPTAELALGGLSALVASADPERRQILRQALEEAGVEAIDGPLEWTFLLGERTRDPDIVVVDGWNEPQAEELVRKIRGDLRLRWAQIGLLQKSNLRRNPLGKLLEKSSEQEARSQTDIDKVFQGKGAVLPLTRLGPARWMRKLAQRVEISHATIETARLRIEFEVADGKVRSVWAARPGRPATGGPEALAAMLSLGSGVMTAHRVDKNVVAPWDVHCEQALREAELALQRVRFSTRPPDVRADVIDTGQSSEEFSAPGTGPAPKSPSPARAPSSQAIDASAGLAIDAAAAQTSSPFSDVRRDLQRRQATAGEAPRAKPTPQKTIAGLGRNLFADAPEDLPLPDLDDEPIVAARVAAAAEIREQQIALSATQAREGHSPGTRETAQRMRAVAGDSQAETRKYPAKENDQAELGDANRKRKIGAGIAVLFLLLSAALFWFRMQENEVTEDEVSTIVNNVSDDSRRRRNIGIMQTVAPPQLGVPMHASDAALESEVTVTDASSNEVAIPVDIGIDVGVDIGSTTTEVALVPSAAPDAGAAIAAAEMPNETTEVAGDEDRLRAHLAAAPDDHHAMIELAEYYVATHRGALAVPLVLRAIDRRRTRASYRILLGDAYRDAGDVMHAGEAYQAALTIDPTDAVARRRITDLGQ